MFFSLFDIIKCLVLWYWVWNIYSL